jgi:hypothetical protein
MYRCKYITLTSSLPSVPKYTIYIFHYYIHVFLLLTTRLREVLHHAVYVYNYIRQHLFFGFVNRSKNRILLNTNTPASGLNKINIFTIRSCIQVVSS